MNIEEWYKLAERGTSGDMVYDILRDWKKEVEELNHKMEIYKQYLSDTSEDMECLEGCDSYGHEDDCPVANPMAAFRKLRQWVDDLQSGMYINCVYCGHRYGPQDEVPASMADVLKEHIEVCPKHPMSKLKKELEQLRLRIQKHGVDVVRDVIE